MSTQASNLDSIELHHDGVRVVVSVRRSYRSKRIRLRVTAEGAEVVLPRRTARRWAEEAVREHASWLVRHVARLSRSDVPELLNRGRVLFEGEWRSVRCQATGNGTVLDDGTHLVIFGKRPDIALEKWMRQLSAARIEQSVAARSSQMRVVPSRVSVRDQKTKWGACTSKGTVTFNWRLVMAPPEVLDYVVVHELAHLRELNHSPRFWAIVAQHCPDWKASRAWLKKNGKWLSAEWTATFSDI